MKILQHALLSFFKCPVVCLPPHDPFVLQCTMFALNDHLSHFLRTFLTRNDTMIPHFVLCSYFGKSHHQADACHLASLYRGFCSIGTHMSVFASSLTSTQVISQSVQGGATEQDSDISQRTMIPHGRNQSPLLSLSDPRCLSIPCSLSIGSVISAVCMLSNAS